MIDDLKILIPEFPERNDVSENVFQNWISSVGSYQLAAGYSFLFWPPFVQFEQYVFLASNFAEENLREWERGTGNNRQAIEAVINHIHLVDLHMDDPDPSEAQLRHLGRVLRETFEAKLGRDFPDLKFEVVFNDEPDLFHEDYEVTFWQTD